MWRLETMHEATPGTVEDVRHLIATVSQKMQAPPADGPLTDLRSGGTSRAAVAARDDRRMVGWAQLVAGNEARAVELVVDDAASPDDGGDALRSALLRAALDLVAADGGGTVHWWSQGAKDRDTRVAAAAGMVPGRRLLQLRRPLPTDLPVDVDTRSFRQGEDEAAWLVVNNRAFADHPEQGGWTIETLLRREAESWFDAAGFRLHERDGRLAAFCWTKLHEQAEVGHAGGPGPPARIGEIYVIGVDPDFQGLGLGRQLTLAGLASIAERGVDLGMLYVDAANIPAVTLYEHLGFTTHRVDVAHSVEVAPQPGDRND